MKKALIVKDSRIENVVVYSDASHVCLMEGETMHPVSGGYRYKKGELYEVSKVLAKNAAHKWQGYVLLFTAAAALSAVVYYITWG